MEMMTEMGKMAEAIRAFEKGEMLIVVDDNDRENEGDLIVSAQFVTPDQMAFIVRHTSGIVCAPMTADMARKLQLNPMVIDNNAPLSTAFTVSVDYRHGLTTGISAAERTATVHALANASAQPEDFVRPGHVFPLIAREGGVLTRSGHTEAAVDLCLQANLPPVGVICELVNDDGSVMRGQQVREFGEKHQLKLISVADLIAWRQRKERLVTRAGEMLTQTRHGEARAISYRTHYDRMDHIALVYGDIRDGEDILVRFHREAVIADVFADNSGLEKALVKISSAGRGVIVYLREGATGVAEENTNEAEDHNSALTREQQWREIGIGAQILAELGISSIHLLASRERHYVGLDGFGIEINATILI